MNSTNTDNSTAPVKKSYETPRLTVHGSLEKITEDIGQYGDDGAIGSRLNL